MPLKNRKGLSLKPLNILPTNTSDINRFDNEKSEGVASGDAEELSSKQIDDLFEEATGKENLPSSLIKGGKSQTSQKERHYLFENENLEIEKNIAKILQEGKIGDNVEYITNNQLGYKLYEIVEGDEVDGKTLEEIGDYLGLYSEQYGGKVSLKKEKLKKLNANHVNLANLVNLKNHANHANHVKLKNLNLENKINMYIKCLINIF